MLNGTGLNSTAINGSFSSVYQSFAEFEVVSAAEVAASATHYSSIDWGVAGRFLIENISVNDLASANWNISATSDHVIPFAVRYLDAGLTASSIADFAATRRRYTETAWVSTATTDLNALRMVIASIDALALSGGELEIVLFSGALAPTSRRFYTDLAANADLRVFTLDPAVDITNRIFVTDPAADASRRIFITEPVRDAGIIFKAA